MKPIICVTLSMSFIGLYLLSLVVSLSSGAEKAELEENPPAVLEGSSGVKKKSPLEMRWSIRDPAMTWNDRTVHLDYATRDWVQRELLSYALYDLECKDELQDPSIASASVEPFAAEGGVQTWRLSLEMGENRGRNAKFCVRFMLHNLAPSKEHALEVNFLRSQLVIQLNEATITAVELSKPDDARIQVNLPGSGRAKVYANDEL
jgi:hypothetical protein